MEKSNGEEKGGLFQARIIQYSTVASSNHTVDKKIKTLPVRNIDSDSTVLYRNVM